MKLAILSLSLIASIALADECEIKQVSQMISQQQVGEITDLVKDITPNKCVVKYKLQVNNEWHTVTWTTTGPEQGEYLCNRAIQDGRTQLMAMIPGKFEAESITVCKDKGTPKFKVLRIGDEILETEVGRVDNSKYFKYNGTTCRRFRERYNDGKLRVNTGVICQADNGFWTVVDKW